MLVRAGVFEAVGGFDSGYDPYGFEDLDFSLRVGNVGYRCIYVPDALVYHDESQTFEKGSYTSRYAHQKAKNWYYFVKRHATPMERVGFWLVGVPFRLLSAAVWGISRGN